MHVCPMQVCQLALLVNIRWLNLSNNRIKTLLSSGLTACVRLEHLLAAGNQLEDPLHCRFFGLLPSLTVLDVRGNPFMGAKDARCACVARVSGCFPVASRSHWLRVFVPQVTDHSLDLPQPG